MNLSEVNAPSWLDLAIENWARWHARNLAHLRCLSLESRYRSPQPWNKPPVTALGRVDVLKAQAVEDAWKLLPHKPKMVLKWWYVLRWSSRDICRQFRRKGFPMVDRDFGLELEVARNMLGQALDASKKNNDNGVNAVVCVQGSRVEGIPSHQRAA